ncbi:MAG: glycosyltransferase family 4 protein [Bryobacterales bacterium]|nr:glycosyltransferase family 4 protein [Bryobacterales bacterium]
MADYAQALLTALRGRVNVAVDAPAADVHLYQLGNNPLHRAMHDRSLANPGVILLHDANLHHYYLGALSREQYIAEFTRQYGEWHKATAAALWERRALSGADAAYFDYPMLGRVVERAQAVIVHNRGAARRVEALRPAAPVYSLPHLLELPAEASRQQVAAWRAEHGLEGCFAVAVFGHLRPTKRVASVLRAVSRLKDAYPRLRLVVAGEAVSAEYAASLAEMTGVVRFGYQHEEAFTLALQAVDAVVSLRYPSSGETSGITLRAMAAARPVLVTEGDEHAAIPEAALCRIEPGVGEPEHLAHVLALLVENPSYRQCIGAQARAHIAQKHAPERVAAELEAILRATIR